MADALLQDDKLWTYADYKAWELKPGERYEIIYGEAYAMSAPGAFHQLILMELSRQFANFLVGKPCKVFAAPFDVRLFYKKDESDDTVVQPDLTVICNKTKWGKEGGRGAPNLIVEILSPSNSATEMQRKFDLYRDAGVQEYWVISSAFKSLTVYLFDKDKKQFTGSTYNEKASVPVTVLEGLFIEMETVFSAE